MLSEMNDVGWMMVGLDTWVVMKSAEYSLDLLLRAWASRMLDE